MTYKFLNEKETPLPIVGQYIPLVTKEERRKKHCKTVKPKVKIAIAVGVGLIIFFMEMREYIYRFPPFLMKIGVPFIITTWGPYLTICIIVGFVTFIEWKHRIRRAIKEADKEYDEDVRIHTLSVEEIEARKRKILNDRVDQEIRIAKPTNDLYWQSKKILSELQQLIDNATGWLKQAQYEYNSNAYGPFWDAVENAAINLASYNDKTTELSRNAEKYYENLYGKLHTFPVFPVEDNIIPDATNALNEFRSIVRMGQTNYQFATIWENRLRREIRIPGFNTLGDVVNNLGRKIEYSIANLKKALVSNIASEVKNYIYTRILETRRIEIK